MENWNSTLYANPNECPVREVLTGYDNFFVWRKQMETALSHINMLGFVDGTKPKPTDPDGISNWEQLDALVMCWIFESISEQVHTMVLLDCKHATETWEKLGKMYGNKNVRKYFIYKQLRDLVQGEMSLFKYDVRLVSLWNELDYIDGIESGKCVPGEESLCLEKWKKRRESEKVMNFLIGLNYKDYRELLNEVLGMDPLPSVDKVFNMALNSDKIHEPEPEGTDVNLENQGYDDDGIGERRSKKKRKRGNYVCGFCGIRGHLEQNCYKLVGYL